MVYTEYKQTGFYPERMFSMNKAMIFFGIAAAVGTGYILAKKYIDKNPEAVAAVKENCSELMLTFPMLTMMRTRRAFHLRRTERRTR